MIAERRLTLTLAACAALVTGCASTAGPTTERLTVYTVNYPLAYFAERIGGDRVRVEFPAPPEGDPATWEPEAQDIAAFQEADLILLNGAGYAGWTRMVSLPDAKVVNTSASFTDRYISEEEETHSHGGDEEHAHEAEIAFTTWLDPQLAVEQAEAISKALSARQPALAAEFRAGFAALRADLRALDDDFAGLFAKLGDAPVMFSHPVYQYLERRYGINGESVHWEPDEPPGDRELLRFADRLVSHPAQIMIWEGKPAPDSIAALATMDVASLALDPCGNRPTEGDYLSVMRENVANLRAAVSD